MVLKFLKFISLFRMIFGKEESISVEKIEKMGLLAVKIAQMYAVRSDLLGSEKCHKLQGLYEQASPILWGEVESILKGEVSEVFWDAVVEIDHTPLATASLGQVHEGMLATGERVVIKVIKPKAKESFEGDLKALRLLARCAVTLYPKLERLADPLGTIDTIARLTRTELNLLNEEKGSRRLEELKDSGSDHLKALHFPKVYRELSTETVLVSEFIPHQSVAKGGEDGSFQYDQLLQLFRAQGFYLFSRGEFHGDLHPGNVLFQGNQLWFLDNANIEEVDPTFTQGLLQFLVKLGAQDYLEAAKVMESLSQSPPQNQERYYQDFQDLYQDFESGKSSLTSQMMETVKLCVHSGMKFPAGAFPVVKSLMYLDGIALKCAPEANLLEDVLEFAQ